MSWRRILGCFLLLACLPAAASADPIRIKTKHPSAETWSWRWYLDLLAGVELSRNFGSASLSSTIRNEQGDRTPVAHGHVGFGGFGIGLLDAPRRTGFGLRADAGFFSKKAVVYGFRQAIPIEENSVDVGATCTDVESGELIDCSQPNRYNLNLWSIYLGPQLHGAFVLHNNSWLEMFAVGTGALRLAEFRSMNATVGANSHKSARFAFFRSVTTGGAVGASLPRHHFSLRVSVDFEYYFRFRYAVPLEFEGPVTYDEERDIYLRPRLLLENASISAVTTTLAAGFLF